MKNTWKALLGTYGNLSTFMFQLSLQEWLGYRCRVWVPSIRGAGDIDTDDIRYVGNIQHRQ